ncbi:MAG: hypothetical protein V3U57_03055 [Robiginitomaculum sp.]
MLAKKLLLIFLKENGVNMIFPTLIWQDADGNWKAVVGNSRKTNALIRKDFAVYNLGSK